MGTCPAVPWVCPASRFQVKGAVLTGNQRFQGKVKIHEQPQGLTRTEISSNTSHILTYMLKVSKFVMCSLATFTVLVGTVKRVTLGKSFPE